MNERLQFETPENVQLQYEPAGLGTRFLAWFVDQIFITIAIVAILVALICSGASFGVLEEMLDPNQNTPEQIGAYFVSIAIIVMGLGSFVYFTLCELLGRGQTLGKRMTSVRVIKVDGFGLDPGSILIRNVFRLADNIPLMWVIPVMSNRSQRTGDMVAGTVVILEETHELKNVRVELAERNASEAEFRFDSGMLTRLDESDFEIIERLLERWRDLSPKQADVLSKKLIASLTTKMNSEPPPDSRRAQYLEDLLAAEIRRQGRLLA